MNLLGVDRASNQKNLMSDPELAVLKVLKESQHEKLRATIDVAEIVSFTGIRDNDEILRALYTLEGKSLVQPEPAGDFTSNHWKITDVGVKALGFVHSA